MIAIEKYLNISDRLSIPFSLSSTYWNDFWDFKLKGSYRIKDLLIGIGYQRTASFDQLLLSTGFDIQLRRPTELEERERKQRRNKRKLR